MLTQSLNNNVVTSSSDDLRSLIPTIIERGIIYNLTKEEASLLVDLLIEDVMSITVRCGANNTYVIEVTTY